MNWLAKINLTIVAERLGPLRSALFLLILIGLCLFTGYRLGNYYHGFQVETLEQQKIRLDELYANQARQVARIHTLEVELAVESLANQGSQTTLKKMENAHYQVKKQLAFYEKVMAPEKEADGLVIDNMKILATQSPNHYRFQVVLVQQQLKKRYAKGFIELSFIGSLDDKPEQLTLANVSSLTRKELSFSFKYFQVVEGEFTLPEKFVPEKIVLSATLPKGKWQKYHKLDKSQTWLLD
ncbi:MAG: hypothetical protein OCD00_04430 [Colwellia sp.]